MGALACRQKIIMNGLMVETIIKAVCYQVQETDYISNSEAEYEMIDYLNEMEDLAFKFQRKFLESQDYDGPWPHALTP